MDVVLVHPAIPQNTGNIGRLCVGLRATLHLIKPLGFDLDDPARRRAGLDYWPHLDHRVHDHEEAFLAWLGSREPWLVSRHGDRRYDTPAYGPDEVLAFGNENTGLPPAWHQRWPHRRLAIPVLGPIRSFNLANAVAVVLTQATLVSGGFTDWTPDQP